MKLWINKQYEHIKSLNVSNSVSDKQIYLLLNCKPKSELQQEQRNLTQIYTSYYYSKNYMVIILLSMHSLSQQFWVSQLHTCMQMPKSSIPATNYFMFYTIPDYLYCDFFHIHMLFVNNNGNELMSCSQTSLYSIK